jgi:hypothetical protein
VSFDAGIEAFRSLIERHVSLSEIFRDQTVSKYYTDLILEDRYGQHSKKSYEI